ncbi:MAG TPA: ABC transporter permease [Candidatus Goldiibacteriota bacterium]|nr:ABC transporter permease [Candidatus Goldiibacteriota bacterium]HRQ43007.1 ABC transporter permease [Candidatus Goldiibacteriota bacterium]
MKPPAFYMIKKEITEIKRTGIIRMLIAAPIIQMIIFGYVATTDIKHVPAAICIEKPSAQARGLEEKFTNSEYFNVKYVINNPEEIDEVLGKSRALIAIRIPADFDTLIKKGKAAKVQLIVDGSDSNASLISMNRASSIIQGFSANVFTEKMEIMKPIIGALPEIKLEERVWYNPELKSANTMVPGVMGMILMIITIIITAVSIVREKENGNIEQLVVTPIKPMEIIAGKTVPYILISIVDILLITAMCLLVFKISLQGSFMLLLSLSIFMIFANLGLGILISTVSSTQQQAMLTSMFFIVPNILLSGFIFPINNMPAALQFISYLLPLTHYNVILKGIFLKDLGFMELLPQTLALLVFGLVIFAAAIKQFKKTVS